MAGKKDDFLAQEAKEAKKAEKKAAKQASKKSEKKKSRKNPFKSIAAFFKSVRSEGKKVVWPTAKDVFKNTVVVLVVILILGVIIYFIDLGLTQGMKQVKNLAQDTTTTAAAEGETTADALEGLVEEDTQSEADTVTATTEEAAD